MPQIASFEDILITKYALFNNATTPLGIFEPLRSKIIDRVNWLESLEPIHVNRLKTVVNRIDSLLKTIYGEDNQIFANLITSLAERGEDKISTYIAFLNNSDNYTDDHRDLVVNIRELTKLANGKIDYAIKHASPQRSDILKDPISSWQENIVGRCTRSSTEVLRQYSR